MATESASRREGPWEIPPSPDRPAINSAGEGRMFRGGEGEPGHLRSATILALELAECRGRPFVTLQRLLALPTDLLHPHDQLPCSLRHSCTPPAPQHNSRSYMCPAQWRRLCPVQGIGPLAWPRRDMPWT